MVSHIGNVFRDGKSKKGAGSYHIHRLVDQSVTFPETEKNV